MLVRKGLFVVLILFFIEFNVISIFADNIENSSQLMLRDWLYVGGGSGNYTTIQSAIDAANPGDTIFVYNGVYYENVILNKDDLKLKGEDKNLTIIDANGSGNGVAINTCVNVLIDNFSIRNAGSNGVIVYSNDWCEENTISNSIIYENQYDGVLFFTENYSTALNNRVMNCEIFDNGLHGISMGPKDGLFIMVGNQISETKCYNNSGWGIKTDGDWDGKDHIISDCEIYTNGLGGIYINSHSNQLLNTSSYQNNGDGICLMNADDVLILNCYIYENTNFGINSSYGIQNGRIYHNNLIDNAQNAYDSATNSWNDSYPSGGNYWSDYMGVDYYHGQNQDILGADGIGDTPYDLPCEHAMDWYPFMESNGWNEPPNPPVIDGPSWGITNVSYTFCFVWTAPDGDEFYYLWDWGDGYTTGWSGPFPSGQMFCANHSWVQKGIYTIRVRLKDVYGVEFTSASFLFIIYDLQKAFIFGRYSNLTEENDCIHIEAINLRLIFCKPFQFLYYSDGETVLFSDAMVLVLPRYIIGRVQVLI